MSSRPPKIEKERRPDAAVVASMAECVELLSEPTRNGVLEPILLDSDLPMFCALLVTAALRADDADAPWFLVRSNENLYITPTAAAETRDIDALYLVELKPRMKSSRATGRVVALLHPFAALVRDRG